MRWQTFGEMVRKCDLKFKTVLPFNDQRVGIFKPFGNRRRNLSSIRKTPFQSLMTYILEKIKTRF